MVIERSSLLNLQILNQNKAGAIGEAPIFVRVVSEEIPRFADLFLSEDNHLGDSAVKEIVTEPYGGGIFIVTAKKRQQFIDDVVADHKGLRVGFEPINSGLVVIVGFDQIGEPETRIDKNHGCVRRFAPYK